MGPYGPQSLFKATTDRYEKQYIKSLKNSHHHWFCEVAGLSNKTTGFQFSVANSPVIKKFMKNLYKEMFVGFKHMCCDKKHCATAKMCSDVSNPLCIAL